MRHRATLPSAIVALVGLTLLAAGCRAGFRQPVEPHDAAQPASKALREGMNPFLLTNAISDRVLVEIDRVEGVEVHPAALDALRETLERYAASGKQIEVRLDDEIPLAVWSARPGGFQERVPGLGEWVDGSADGDAELIYVVYVPDEPDFMGWSQRYVLEVNGEPRAVDTILMFPATFDRATGLWITRQKVERALLVHELGHVLGLVSGPDHRERGNPRHCTEPQCVMTHPNKRSQAYNALPTLFAGRVPHDYCNKCRADIETARSLWQAEAEDPGFARQLRERRQIETLLARACWYGRQRRFHEALAAVREARTLSGEQPAAQSTDDVKVLTELCPSGAGW